MEVVMPDLADIIPDPETIRARLDRAETEADLLRRQLRLALRRQEEADRLDHARRPQGRPAGGPADSR
jgi:hypothetical protein